MSTVDKTLAERGARYGDFSDHAILCQDLKGIMRDFTLEEGLRLPWFELTAVQQQALEVIADKIARILSGDPNYADNWHDIQGYAKLVEDRLPKEILPEEPVPKMPEKTCCIHGTLLYLTCVHCEHNHQGI